MSRYIDAEKLIAKLHSGDNYLTILPLPIREIEEMLIDEMVGYVNEVPTADVKPIVRGEWLIHTDTERIFGICSVCNFIQYAGKSNFCPNCGADMRKE